jgi:hypothetical protein
MDNVSRIPHIKISSGVRSGLPEGQVTGPLLPIHLLGNLEFRACQTLQLKWGSAHPVGKQLQFPSHFQCLTFVTLDLNSANHMTHWTFS